MAVPVLYEKICSCSIQGAFVTKSKSSHYSVKEAVRTTFCQSVNHFLEKNATDYIIAEADSKISYYFKPSTTSTLNFANELWLKTIRCPYVYYEIVFEVNFAEGLPQSQIAVCKHTRAARALHRCMVCLITALH